MRTSSFLLPMLSALSSASLLVDYKGGESTSTLGSCQLEGQNLEDHISCPGNSSISIKPGQDPSGKAALVYHRDSHFRRAEVKAGSTDMWEAEKEYYVGYNFMITNNRKSLVLYQWKRDDKNVEPQDNIPFHLEFAEDGKLNLQVTTPRSNGSNRTTLATAQVSTNEAHNIALAFDTKMNGGDNVSQNNRLAWWLDGEHIFDKAEYSLWSSKTGTYPKFGLYRGEDDGYVTYRYGLRTLDADDAYGSYDDGNNPDYIFDSYVYRVQISDTGFADITDSSGVPGSTE